MSPVLGRGGGGDRKAISIRPFPCALPLPEAFSVDMDSGLVTTQRPLQSYERFNLTVVATDGGEPPLWGTTMLLVEVIDVNDNRPVFVRPPNGTVLHIKEVFLIPGPCSHSRSVPTCSPLTHPAFTIWQSRDCHCESVGTEATQGGQTCPVPLKEDP